MTTGTQRMVLAVQSDPTGATVGPELADEPLVRRLLAGELAAGEPSLAEELPVEEDERAHGRSVLPHELLTRRLPHVERGHFERVSGADELLQRLVRVCAVVAGG